MIFRKYIQLKNNRLRKKNNSESHSVSYNEAKLIGIVFTHKSVSQIDWAEQLSALFKKDGKKVKIMAYEPSREVNHLPFDTFTDKDITFWGNYTRSNVNTFIDEQFDFLFCIDEEPNTIVENILMSSHAKCRVGKYREGSEDIYDLMIAPGTDNEWLSGMHTYVKRIN